MPEIILRIDKKTAAMTMEGVGYSGPKCVTDIEEVVKAMNASTVSRKAKPELARRVTTQTVKR